MKYLVLGSGQMGTAVAFDLAQAEDTEEIVLADIDEERARHTAEKIGSANVRTARLDVNYYDDVLGLMAGHDVAVSAVLYKHNVLLTKAAIETGVSLCDLGGNNEVVEKQRGLHLKAEQGGVTILPNCGLAPGMANVIAVRGVNSFDAVDELHIRVGGLPQNPRPPLNYQLVFSPEGLINEYIEKAEIIRHGNRMKVESMTELEDIAFPQPFNGLEAFHTSGGISSLARLFEGRIRELDYKTIRYKGHCQTFKVLIDLGFTGSEPSADGTDSRTPREIFGDLLERTLTFNDKDVVLMRITISGEKDGKRRTRAWEMVDYYDEKNAMTAMMRTTGYSTSIIAQMVARGQIHQRGVFLPEQVVDGGILLKELAARNIDVRECDEAR